MWGRDVGWPQAKAMSQPTLRRLSPFPQTQTAHPPGPAHLQGRRHSDRLGEDGDQEEEGEAIDAIQQQQHPEDEEPSGRVESHLQANDTTLRKCQVLRANSDSWHDYVVLSGENVETVNSGRGQVGGAAQGAACGMGQHGPCSRAWGR